jgi:uncharacterized lipoprotein YajG
MLKKITILTAVVTIMVLTGCDAGSNSYSKCSQPTSVTQVAQLSSNIAKESK